MNNTCKTCGEDTYPCKCMRDFISGRDRTALKFYTQAQHDQAIKEAVENVCKERDEEIKNEILKLFPHFDSTANTILLMISNMPQKTGN